LPHRAAAGTVVAMPGWEASAARSRTRDADLLVAALGQGRPAASALELVGIDRATGARRILRNLADRRADSRRPDIRFVAELNDMRVRRS